MKASRLNSTPTAPAEGLTRGWVRFWFTPLDPVGLHVLRVVTGLLVLAWLLPFAGYLNSMFSLEGWIDQAAYREITAIPDGPGQSFTWSVVYLLADQPTWLAAYFWLSVAVAALFTLGLWPRVTAVLTWVAVASFTANPLMVADVDVLLLILTMYLMVGYVALGQRDPNLSLAQRILGPWPAWLRQSSAPRPSLAANLALRLLQVHFAIVMVTTGLHKLQFGPWWAGVALWFPLHPPFQTTLQEVMALRPDREQYLLFLSLAGYLILAFQIGFPLFAWRPRWRPVVLGGAVCTWIGAAWMYELPLYGPAVVACCLSYVTPAEWHRLFDWLAQLPGLQGLSAWLPVPPADNGELVSKKEASPLITAGQR